MKVKISGNGGEDTRVQSIQSEAAGQKRYVMMKGGTVPNELVGDIKSPPKFKPTEPEIVKSKVLVIDKLIVTITEKLNEDFTFKIDTKFAPVNGITPEFDICSKEDIEFTPETRLSDIESIIRRCGILEKYNKYFTRDPEIVINSFKINIERELGYFAEFNSAMMIARDIF